MEKNLGHATAYGYAKSKGYSGTEDEFAELMADYASVGQSAAQSAEQAAASAESASGSAATASQAAQTATSKASEAVTAADTAITKASEASQSASTASTAATSASTSAQTATTAASTANTKASEAAVSANTATTAKTDAETARDAAAQSASAAAESARTLTIDATLTQRGQAADAKATGDRLGGIESDLSDVKEKTFGELFIAGTALTITQTVTGYGLLANGRRAENASHAIDIYSLSLNNVSEGEPLHLKISADTAGVYQFQTSGGIPVNYDPNNVVGGTVTEAVDGIVVVPTSALYLSVSRNIDRTDNVIAKKESRLDDIENDIDDLQLIGDNFETHLIGENLVDSEQLEAGYYYLRGVKTASAALTSAWIDVEDIDVINASGRKLSDSTWSGVEMYYICAFDESKTYIADSMINTGVKQFTVPDGAKYLTVSYVNSTYSEFTVVAGTKRPVRYVNSEQKTILMPQHYGIWYGKKWSAMGDSLTEYNSKNTKNYIEYISENTGITPTNLGVGGTGYRRGVNNGNSFYDRVNTIPNDCDVLTIFGSLNDTGGGQTLGTINDDISNDTVFGYVNATLDAIYAAIPSINIGIISPTPWKDSRPWDSTESASKYSEGLKQICYNRGIPFLDLYHCSNLRPWDATARDLFYSKDLVDGVNAGCHPDSNGHKMIAPKIEAFLETLLI